MEEMRKWMDKETAFFNCKGVWVFREMRINTFLYIFALPDERFIEVELPPVYPSMFQKVKR